MEALDPLFHLFNGDLCYANVSDDPVGTWTSFFTNNTRSAANRPWMPAVGNHENEVGNGPQGYLSYQTRFELPDNHSPEFRGNWYAFTVGSIRVISLNNDDSASRTAGSAPSGVTTSRPGDPVTHYGADHGWPDYTAGSVRHAQVARPGPPRRARGGRDSQVERRVLRRGRRVPWAIMVR